MSVHTAFSTSHDLVACTRAAKSVVLGPADCCTGSAAANHAIVSATARSKSERMPIARQTAFTPDIGRSGLVPRGMERDQLRPIAIDGERTADQPGPHVAQRDFRAIPRIAEDERQLGLRRVARLEEVAVARVVRVERCLHPLRDLIRRLIAGLPQDLLDLP